LGFLFLAKKGKGKRKANRRSAKSFRKSYYREGNNLIGYSTIKEDIEAKGEYVNFYNLQKTSCKPIYKTPMSVYKTIYTESKHKWEIKKLEIFDLTKGYSLRLKPDIIKMDMNLIRDIDTEPAKKAVVSSLVRLAAEIGSKTIA